MANVNLRKKAGKLYAQIKTSVTTKLYFMQSFLEEFWIQLKNMSCSCIYHTSIVSTRIPIFRKEKVVINKALLNIILNSFSFILIFLY